MAETKTSGSGGARKSSSTASRQDTEPGGHDNTDNRWRQLVALGVLVGDLSPRTIARFGGVHLLEAEAAIANATARGVIEDGHVDAVTAERLLAELDPAEEAEVHAVVARQLLTRGSARIAEAVDHARSAATLAPLEDLVALADQRGQTSLSINSYENARMLFELADELDLASTHEDRARRLLLWARAMSGLGRITEARALLSRAADLAELAGNADLLTEAAVRYAMPADWYAGDRRAAALLQRAQEMQPSTIASVAIDAARAMVEMRMPLPGSADNQVAWITRASVAQPLADRAVNSLTPGFPRDVRCGALLAWRATHRAPEFLAMRRERSTEALDLAQSERMPELQVEAAIMLGVDALESGDRPLFDEALTVARWVADSDGNPRLGWLTSCIAAGGALIDGDLEASREHRESARRFGSSVNTPGWIGAELLLAFEQTLFAQDWDEAVRFLVDDDEPIMESPIARLCSALVCVQLGDSERAERNLRRAIRQLDPEASYLLVATLAANVAVQLDVPDVVDQLLGILTPWKDHVAVDSSAWWCNGPVPVALAELHLARGDHKDASAMVDAGESMARPLNDVRSLARIDRLRTALAAYLPAGDDLPSDVAPAAQGAAPGVQLTAREWKVLELMAGGYTNPRIATELAYSLSTIRMDTISIYRKLGVKGRAEAVAKVAGFDQATSG